MMANENPPPASKRGFFTPPPPPPKSLSSPTPASQWKPPHPHSAGKHDLFHVIHKVPAGDSPYVRAKHVQLIDKDPSRAVSLFWAAINSGDRVDSALKDMAIVMKQLNRSDEAIEAIKSFRHLIPTESQESIDNILIELYKRSGRIEEEIQLLKQKLKNIEEGIAFGGKKTKTARSQGKKVEITLEKEYSRLLGNLAWAHMQLKNFKLAEENYRKALSLEPDRNKQCNLAICLMQLNKISEAKFLLQSIRASSDYKEMDDSCHKSLERAMEVLAEIESQNTVKCDESDSIGTEDKAKKESVSCQRKYGSYFTKGHLQSPSSAGRIPIPFTQPRKFNGCRYRRWSRTIRKLPFEQYSNEHKSDVGLSQRSSSSSDFGDWRNVSWENCNVPKTQSAFPEIQDGKWRRDSKQQNGKKLMESISFTIGSSNLERKLCDSCREQDGQNMKKSWADMVEEDELVDISNDHHQDDIDEFNDENANSNMIHKTPSLKNLAENLSQCVETLDLNGGYYTQPEGDFFTIQTPLRLKQRNRLQVFQDITPVSPRF